MLPIVPVQTLPRKFGVAWRAFVCPDLSLDFQIFKQTKTVKIKSIILYISFT